MSTSDDRPRPDEPIPPAWDAPPQPPAWDRPSQGAPGSGGPGYGAPYDAPAYGPPPGQQTGWGPPPGYPSPAGYGTPGSGAYGPQQTDTKAILALVLAIGSFVVCPVVPAIIALVLAGGSKRDIEASGGRLTGLGLVRAARIVSWIHLGLCLLGVVAFALVFGVLAAGAGTVSY